MADTNDLPSLLADNATLHDNTMVQTIENMFNTTIKTTFLLVTPEQYSLAMKFILVFQISVTGGGILANSVSIQMFYRMGLNDCVTITFFNLTFSDLVALLVYSSDILVKILYVINAEDEPFPPIFGMDPRYLQFFVWKCHDAFFRSSLLFIAFLAMQRTLCIIRPFHFKTWFTLKRTLTIVSIIWAYCLVFAVAQLSFTRIVLISTGNGNATVYVLSLHAADAWTWIQFINDTTVIIVGNLFVVVGLIVMIYGLKLSVQFRQTASTQPKGSSIKANKVKVKTSTQGTSGKRSGSGDSKERQAIVQVVILCTFCLMALVPNVLFAIAMAIEPQLGTLEYYFFRMLCIQTNAIFGLANASVNFIVYYKYNTKFRQILMQTQRVKVKA